MQVASYARVSTANQPQESAMASQVRLLKDYIQKQGWSVLAEHEFGDEGLNGAQLNRPGLERLREAARHGQFAAVVVLSAERLARNYADLRFLMEEFEQNHLRWVFLESPFGGRPLDQGPGMVTDPGAGEGRPAPVKGPAPSTQNCPGKQGGGPCK
jgi:site-specific DNA recombinase